MGKVEATPCTICDGGLTMSVPKCHIVYLLSFSNGKGYVGVTNDMERRLLEHVEADTETHCEST